MERRLITAPIENRILRGCAGGAVLCMALGLTPFAPAPFAVAGDLDSIGTAVVVGTLAMAATLSLLGRDAPIVIGLAMLAVLAAAMFDGRLLSGIAELGVQNGDPFAALAALILPCVSVSALAGLMVGASKVEDRRGETQAPTARASRQRKLLGRGAAILGRHRKKSAEAKTVVPRRVTPDLSLGAPHTPRPQPIQPLGTRRVRKRPERHVTPRAHPAVRRIRVSDTGPEVYAVPATDELQDDQPLLLTSPIQKPTLVAV